MQLPLAPWNDYAKFYVIYYSFILLTLHVQMFEIILVFSDISSDQPGPRLVPVDQMPVDHLSVLVQHEYPRQHHHGHV